MMTSPSLAVKKRVQLLERLKNVLTIQFIDYEKHSKAIMSIRKDVFQKEQGFASSVVYSEMDNEGIHLGAFEGNQLISCVSAYLLTGKEEIFKRYGLPKPKRLAVQYTKRVELLNYRKVRLNEYLSGLISKSIYEVVRPDIVFLWTLGIHREMSRYYRLRFGLRMFGEIEHEAGQALVLLSQGGEINRTLSEIQKNRQCALSPL